MDEARKKMVELNVSGRVLLLCNTHGIRDPETIQAAKERVTQEIIALMEAQGLDIRSLSGLLDERLRNLSLEELKHPIATGRVAPAPEVKTPSPPPRPEPQPEAPNRKTTESPSAAEKPSTDIRRKSKDMVEKLATERKPIQRLVTEDCVQLGLLEQERAQYIVRQFPGKEVSRAEQEVVAELRNNLHKHVRLFIRKHGGGPWPSPKEQEDLRLEIANTPTVRSVLFLTRQILQERQEWLEKSRKTLTGRLFGERLKLRRGEKANPKA